MELFLLGVVVGVVGAKGKRILKPLARGYLEVAERAREYGAELRENFEDALAEARYEREQEAVAAQREGDEETPAESAAGRLDAEGGNAHRDGAEPAAARHAAR